MNDLMSLNQNNNTLTMTSREIANLTNKEHKHVKRDIEVMLDQLDLDKSNFGRIYLDSLNRQQTEYILDEDLTKTLITGYSAPLRLAVIKRLNELERETAFKIPSTLGEALQLAATQAMKIEADAKKVNHYDLVVDRTNLMTASQVGQKLGITANKLNKHLEILGVYNQSVKRGRVFQQWFIDNDYGTMKEANKGYSQALITAKGQAFIVEKLTYNKADIEKMRIRQDHTSSVISQIENILRA